MQRRKGRLKRASAVPLHPASAAGGATDSHAAAGHALAPAAPSLAHLAATPAPHPPAQPQVSPAPLGAAPPRTAPTPPSGRWSQSPRQERQPPVQGRAVGQCKGGARRRLPCPASSRMACRACAVQRAAGSIAGTAGSPWQRRFPSAGSGHLRRQLLVAQRLPGCRVLQQHGSTGTASHGCSSMRRSHPGKHNPCTASSSRR